MREGRERFDGGGEFSRADQGVFSDVRVTACVTGTALHGDFKAVAAAETHGDVVKTALGHDGVVGGDLLFRDELIGTLTQAFFIRHEARENLPGEFVLVVREIFQRRKNGGKAPLHVHGTAPVDFAVDQRCLKRVGRPVFGDVYRIEVSDQEKRLSGAAAVERCRERRSLVFRIFGEVTPVGRHAEGFQHLVDVARGVNFPAVDGIDVDEIKPAFVDFFQGHLFVFLIWWFRQQVLRLRPWRCRAP